MGQWISDIDPTGLSTVRLHENLARDDELVCIIGKMSIQTCANSSSRIKMSWIFIGCVTLCVYLLHRKSLPISYNFIPHLIWLLLSPIIVHACVVHHQIRTADACRYCETNTIRVKSKSINLLQQVERDYAVRNRDGTISAPLPGSDWLFQCCVVSSNMQKQILTWGYC